MYHEVEAQGNGEPHHLVTKTVSSLHEDYKVDLPLCSEGDEFILMLCLFARKYSTHDIVKEYRMVGVWPVRGG